MIVVVVTEHHLPAGLDGQPHRGAALHHQLGVLQQKICVTWVALNIDPSADLRCSCLAHDSNVNYIYFILISHFYSCNED